MSFVSQRHFSWLKLFLSGRPTLGEDASSHCGSCRNLFALQTNLTNYVSSLAETGYAEGQMCHTLMRGERSHKVNVAISTPMLVR